MKKLALLLALGATLWCQVPGETFSITGVVIDAGGRPVNHVRVAVASVLQRDMEQSLVTSSNGRFSFAVPSGKFQLTAQRNGEPRQGYAQAAVYSGFSTAVVTGAGLNTGNLVFRMLPLSSISGRVVDEYGEPVENALMQLIQSRIVEGTKRLQARGWFYTDDRGEYRFGQLAAGTYYLAVSAHPWASETRFQLKSEFGNAFAPVYYPNTTDPRTAAALALKPGESAAANFSLQRISGAAVHVTLQASENAICRVTLEFMGLHGVESFDRVLQEHAGNFTIPAVPRGRYTLRATSGSTAPMTASQTFEVNGADIEISLTPKEPIAVSGSVEIEGGDQGIAGRLLFVLTNQANGRTASRPVSATGDFTVPMVGPGVYRTAIGGSSGYYARQVRANGVELTDGLLTITDTPVRLAVAASRGVGRVNGFVYRAGQPVVGAVVVLAAVSPAAATSRGFQTDSDGSFDIENVRPGEYRLFTVDRFDFEYANPAVLKPYLQGAKTMQISPDSTFSERIELP